MFSNCTAVGRCTSLSAPVLLPMQEPRLALVDVQLPQEALDAQPGNAVPAGLTMRVSTAGNADVLEVHMNVASTWLSDH